jgi:hypothetical protein
MSVYFYEKREGSGSVMVIYGFGCGSGRPKNIRIRIPNTVHKELNTVIVPAVALPGT